MNIHLTLLLLGKCNQDVAGHRARFEGLGLLSELGDVHNQCQEEEEDAEGRKEEGRGGE